MLARMTEEEKMDMLHGTVYGKRYIGWVPPNDRLGIPGIRMNDGPQGFRDEHHPGTTTAWSSGLNVGATWDADLAYKWGEAMGREFREKGANVLLGPGMNVARVPKNGRNFEYVSGGDPYLGYTMVQPVIKGIQSQGVIANVKHFIDNNQEGALWLNGGNGSHGHGRLGAEMLMHEALEAQRETLGDRHPDTLASIWNLCMLKAEQGKHGEAKQL